MSPLLLHIERILKVLDGSFLEQNDCFLGGGAAAILHGCQCQPTNQLIFFCCSKRGYRDVFGTLYNKGASGILRNPDVSVLREPKAGMHSIKLALGDRETPVILEIRKENRIEISGAKHPVIGLPVLSKEDLFTEQLLTIVEAHTPSQRPFQQISHLNRMIEAWGPVPKSALEKGRSVYGELVDDVLQSPDLRSSRC